MVSVVAAVFNGDRDVETACRSVLDQSYHDLELVVVDDASTDQTPAILARLAAADSRLRVVRNDSQCGQTRSLNRGVQLSRGEWIGRIDADDCFLPGKIARQMEFLSRRGDVTVVGTWAMRVSESGAPVGLFRAPVDAAEIDYRLLQTSPMCHVSVLMRRDAVLTVGGYGNDYRYAADYKLWSDLRRAGHTLANIPEVLVQYRTAESTFGGASRLDRAADEAAAVIEENARSLAGLTLPLPVCRAIHLRTTEGAGLSDAMRREVFLALAAMARCHYPRVPWHLRRRLFLEALWSFSIGTRAERGDTRLEPGEGEAARPLWLATAEWLGRCSGRLGLKRLARVRAFVRRQVPVR